MFKSFHKLDQSLIHNLLCITEYTKLRIQLVQNAPDDGPMRSETCRANLGAE